MQYLEENIHHSIIVHTLYVHLQEFFLLQCMHEMKALLKIRASLGKWCQIHRDAKEILISYVIWQ